MVTAHRQACDGAVALGGTRAVVVIHPVHDVVERLLKRAVHPVLVCKCGLHVSLITHAGSGLLVHIAVWHDYNHGLGFAAGDKVIKHLCGAALLEPHRLVAARPVQQVEDGIALAALLIARGQINHHASRLSQGGGVVPHGPDLAMGNIMYRHGTVALRVKDKSVHHVLDVAQHLGIFSIQHLHAINGEVVHIQVGLQVTQGDAPGIIARVLHQRVQAGVNNQAHGVGCRSLDLEGHCPVPGDVGTVNSRRHIASLGVHTEAHGH